MNRFITVVLSLLVLAGCASPSSAKAECNPFASDLRSCLEANSLEQARVAAQNLANLQAHQQMQQAAQVLSQTTSNLEPRVAAQGNVQVQEAFAELTRINTGILSGLNLSGFPVDVVDGPITGIEFFYHAGEMRTFRIRDNANANATVVCFLPKTVATSLTETSSRQVAILLEPSRYSSEDIVAAIRATIIGQTETLHAVQSYDVRLQEIASQTNALRDELLVSGRDPFFSISSSYFLSRQLTGELNADPNVVCATKATIATQLLGITERIARLIGKFVP